MIKGLILLKDSLFFTNYIRNNSISKCNNILQLVLLACEFV